MDNWDEVRTAYHVARMGTVSGAADVLGVHHATVIRHVDALEARLGVKLFQRHARGYTATEAGEDLCRVAQATDEQFSQLAGRVKGKGDEVSGELVVTSLNGLAPFMLPLIADFQDEYPDVTVNYLTGIRAGSIPEQPDNVVQPFLTQSVGLYASKKYIEQFGTPKSLQDYANHRFVGQVSETSRAPFFKWMSDNVPRDNIIFRSNDNRALELAIRAGVGIGFMMERDALDKDNVVQIEAPREEWNGALWLVTHVDLHRTVKVQAFLKFAKDAAHQWGKA